METRKWNYLEFERRFRGLLSNAVHEKQQLSNDPLVEFLCRHYVSSVPLLEIFAEIDSLCAGIVLPGVGSPESVELYTGSFVEVVKDANEIHPHGRLSIFCMQAAFVPGSLHFDCYEDFENLIGGFMEQRGGLDFLIPETRMVSGLQSQIKNICPSVIHRIQNGRFSGPISENRDEACTLMRRLNKAIDRYLNKDIVQIQQRTSQDKEQRIPRRLAHIISPLNFGIKNEQSNVVKLRNQIFKNFKAIDKFLTNNPNYPEIKDSFSGFMITYCLELSDKKTVVRLQDLWFSFLEELNEWIEKLPPEPSGEAPPPSSSPVIDYSDGTYVNYQTADVLRQAREERRREERRREERRREEAATLEQTLIVAPPPSQELEEDELSPEQVVVKEAAQAQRKKKIKNWKKRHNKKHKDVLDSTPGMRDALNEVFGFMRQSNNLLELTQKFSRGDRFHHQTDGYYSVTLTMSSGLRLLFKVDHDAGFMTITELKLDDPHRG